MTDALDAVVDAALERALVAESDARRYFALAGALERARTEASSPAAPDGSRASAPDDCGGVEVGPLAAALMSTVAVERLADPEAGIDVGAWSPGRDAPQTDLVGAGAVAASERFDVDVDVIAARSGITREDLARYRASLSD